MVSQHVVELCHSSATVSSELAKHPTASPGSIAKTLYHGGQTGHVGPEPLSNRAVDEEDLEKAFSCGKWGNSRPSDLFLRARSLNLSIWVRF